MGKQNECIGYAFLVQRIGLSVTPVKQRMYAIKYPNVSVPLALENYCFAPLYVNDEVQFSVMLSWLEAFWEQGNTCVSLIIAQGIASDLDEDGEGKFVSAIATVETPDISTHSWIWNLASDSLLGFYDSFQITIQDISIDDFPAHPAVDSFAPNGMWKLTITRYPRESY